MADIPTFAELAEYRISDAGPRDKNINLKITIPTASMMVEADKRIRGSHGDLLQALELTKDCILEAVRYSSMGRQYDFEQVIKKTIDPAIKKATQEPIQ